MRKGRYAFYKQYNSGDPAPPWYGVHVNGTAYEGNVSGSYAGAAKEVCLSTY
jgi:hypothetical protein